MTDQVAAFERLVERRAAGEPVAYIRGIKEFYGLAFTVDARALIPRPETELLVELASSAIRATLTGAPRPADAPPLLVWDVGTGSGAIAVALAVDAAGAAATARTCASWPPTSRPTRSRWPSRTRSPTASPTSIDFAAADLLRHAPGRAPTRRPT